MIKDGKENARYLLMDMTKPQYQATENAFRKLHTDKFADNTLTVLPNIANTRAIIKVVAHVGWIEEERGRLQAGLASGLILEIHRYAQLPRIYELLASPEWPKEPLLEAEASRIKKTVDTVEVAPVATLTLWQRFKAWVLPS